MSVSGRVLHNPLGWIFWAKNIFGWRVFHNVQVGISSWSLTCILVLSVWRCFFEHKNTEDLAITELRSKEKIGFLKPRKHGLARVQWCETAKYLQIFFFDSDHMVIQQALILQILWHYWNQQRQVMKAINFWLPTSPISGPSGGILAYHDCVLTFSSSSSSQLLSLCDRCDTACWSHILSGFVRLFVGWKPPIFEGINSTFIMQKINNFLVLHRLAASGVP